MPWSELVGCGVDAIDTPTLVVDLDAMERNIARMADFARAQGVRWRPHAKMHKSSWIARQLVEAGAVGACVQKTAEALALADGGVHDLYISNEVIAPHKLARVAALAVRLQHEGGRLAIAVDSPLGVERLAQALAGADAGPAAVDVFIEVDVGHGRCGVASPEPAVALARQIAALPRLRLAGLQAYHGRAQHQRGVEERSATIASVVDIARRTRAAIEAAGLCAPLITGSGTGTLPFEACSGVYGEVQAGSFLFMDADYAANAPDPRQPAFEHALFLKSQVMSRGEAHAVCDAGHKSHAIDSGLPRVHSLPGTPALQYFNGGDEHGILRAETPCGVLPELGDTVWLIPGHCDPTVNLHNRLVGLRGGLAQGRVERIIEVDARGALA